MKNLIDSIIDYSKKYINSENEWYNWREINEEKLPNGIILPNGNQFKKNIALKKELNGKWTNAKGQDEKNELIKYYITTWGGIHTNNSDLMIEYSTLSASQLITSKKKQGIASWSKAIVIHNPNQYAIFDARVSISLNCLQKLYNLSNKTLFPTLASRNKVVDFGNQLIKKVSKSEKWLVAEESTFYLDYLEILRTVSVQLNTDISPIEMLLFAKAEELVEKTFEAEYSSKFEHGEDAGWSEEDWEWDSFFSCHQKIRDGESIVKNLKEHNIYPYRFIELQQKLPNDIHIPNKIFDSAIFETYSTEELEGLFKTIRSQNIKGETERFGDRIESELQRRN